MDLSNQLRHYPSSYITDGELEILLDSSSDSRYRTVKQITLLTFRYIRIFQRHI
jgi:hypothetical protein